MSETSPQPKLGYLILYVPNVLDAVAFYERAFGLARRFVHESEQYAEMETGATALAFADEGEMLARGTIEPSRAERKAAAAEVALVVENVRAAFDASLAAGAIAVVEPTDKPWGQTVSYVRDLNGFLVELCSPVN
jgi:lactoylglutathione lyase